MGSRGCSRAARRDLSGILNGIDLAVWDPAHDPHLPAYYCAAEPGPKTVCKAALQARLGLAQRPEAPLLGVVSRLSPQKGLDLLLQALPFALARGAQIAMLAAGDAELEEAFQEEADRHPQQVGVTIGYAEPLSHLIQGGADAVLVPSRSEPCGLTQLYGLRYGSLPIVARVGGLADSVIDANAAALEDGVATGFVFAPVTPEALQDGLERALALYREPLRWRTVQARAMTREVGWDASAARYLALYQDLLRERHSGV